jgi:hypothetical protein
MAYLTRNLSILAYANGFTLWHYRTRETLATVLSADYFAAGYEMFRHGDFVLVNAEDQGATLMIESRAAGAVSAVPLNATAPPMPARAAA